MVLSGRVLCFFGCQSLFVCSMRIYQQPQNMTNRVSNEQLDELLEFLAQHPTLTKGVGLGARSKEAVDRQWNELAMRLNAFGSGSSKTGEKWKKYWADIKHKTKSRLARRRQDALGTGGGPSSQGDLSELDKKILAIIGEQAIYGDTQHRVPVFNIQPEVDIAPAQMENIDVLDEVIITDVSELTTSVDTMNAQVPEQPELGESSMRHKAKKRAYPRDNETNIGSRQRIDPEWVMELEKRRVDSEAKTADAIHLLADNNAKIADAMNSLAESNAKMVEVMSKIVEFIVSKFGGQ